MYPFAAARSVLHAVWAVIDSDEPTFCDCRGAWVCPDCALSAPVESHLDWTVLSGAPPVAAR